MKLPKIKIVCPGIEVELQRPIIGRLYALIKYPAFCMVRKIKFKIIIPSKIAPRYAGHIIWHRMWVICLPKMKFTKGGKDND